MYHTALRKQRTKCHCILFSEPIYCFPMDNNHVQIHWVAVRCTYLYRVFGVVCIVKRGPTFVKTYHQCTTSVSKFTTFNNAMATKTALHKFSVCIMLQRLITRTLNNIQIWFIVLLIFKWEKKAMSAATVAAMATTKQSVYFNQFLWVF